MVDGTVVRQPKAYPIYDAEYAGCLDTIKPYLGGFANLQTIGRNGLHKYNNQDHSMLTARAAVDCIATGRVDKDAIWRINVDDEYQESK